MKRKLLKYVKFFLSLFLIALIVSSSFASGDVGADVAFVTKDEFDKALAAFNTRLTTFEAGINSKIDSQVTSYLDRNGIWNATEQTMLLDDAVTGRTLLSNVLIGNLVKGTEANYVVQGPNWGSDMASYPWINMNQTLGTNIHSTWDIDVNNKKYVEKKKLFKSTKSGLVCLEFSLSWITTFNAVDVAGQTYDNGYTTKVDWHGYNGMVFNYNTNYMYDWVNILITMTDDERLAYKIAYADIPRADPKDNASGMGISVMPTSSTTYKDIAYSCGLEFLREEDPTDSSKDKTCYSMNFFRWNRALGIDLVGYPADPQPEYTGWRLPATILPEYFVAYFFVDKGKTYKIGFVSKWDGRRIDWFCLPSRHSLLPPNGWLIYDWQKANVY